MFYWLSNNNQTDLEDEREGFQMEGLEVEGRKGIVGEGSCEGIILCLKGQCHEICFWFFS
jgi:hypothetical protein